MTIKISGAGDIGSPGIEGGRPIEWLLLGLIIALVIMPVVAVPPRPTGRRARARHRR